MQAGKPPAFAASAGSGAEQARRGFPRFVTSIGGERLDLLPLAEQKTLVVVTLKATWCPVCQAQLRRRRTGDLDRSILRQDYESAGGVVGSLHKRATALYEAAEPAPVVCRLERREAGLAMLIEDRGPGLPPQVRERLFQPFVTGRPDGVGLGLSLAHRIVGLHGGTLRLEDREAGGTRAVISFPADAVLD